MRLLSPLILLCATVAAFGSAGQDEQAKRINDRVQHLRQVLLAREAPDFMLVPSIDSQTRANQGKKVMRPYVWLQFEYSMADLRWKGDNAAELPLRVEWKTAKVDSSISGTAQLVRVGDEWYFRSFDFLLFPWREIILASLLAVAFTSALFALYRRWRKPKAVVTTTV
jgi:hypothetical protein